MNEHKPNCDLNTAFDGYPLTCTCGADKPTPSAPTAEQVREAREYVRDMTDKRIATWSDSAIDAAVTLLTALDRAQEECADRAAVQADLAHQLNAFEHDRVVPLIEERDAVRAALDKAQGEMERLLDVMKAHNIRPQGKSILQDLPEWDALCAENARLVEELATADRTEIKLVQRLNAAEARVGEVREKNAAQAEQIKRLREAMTEAARTTNDHTTTDYLDAALRGASK